jgi:hypothetical protein
MLTMLLDGALAHVFPENVDLPRLRDISTARGDQLANCSNGKQVPPLVAGVSCQRRSQVRVAIVGEQARIPRAFLPRFRLCLRGGNPRARCCVCAL